jgi:hypothetical protein
MVLSQAEKYENRLKKKQLEEYLIVLISLKAFYGFESTIDHIGHASSENHQYSLKNLI